ncbi:MBL fold metallo-hydrolase [Massilia pseudoviolaceinigra]|uniref:MBL fold metallo-hydrolase n=1 Tax=Massilia pseudoviolaceinigra TaxID=3057165 RepID=UPI002796D163|nr:MBL fold metallo-hydrolase [Massilia sp. CCM 9206]MDQ1923579.1 MBL fold metallo-hydrolase [Massilia sp. CCM 9206]
MNNTAMTGCLAAAFLAFGMLAPHALAQIAPVSSMTKAQAGYYHFKVGNVNVTALSDGTLAIPPGDLLTNVAPGQVAARLAATFQGTHVHASVNAYLIESGSRLVLVDTGSGELYGPTLNKLVASLQAVGYQPGQITDILITHIHTDHTGGLMNGQRMVFPNATLHVDARELDYWMSATNRARAPDNKRQHFDEALMKVRPYVDAGQVKPFHGATQLVPGLRSVPSYGHTPGHSFYVLESGGEKLVFWGDLLHVAEVQMPDPAVTIVFDVDPVAAAAERKRAFAEAAREKYWVAGDHIAFPGVGRLRADGDGYRWVPMPYMNDHVAPAAK